ncbi:MAG: hypothetical protein A3E07_02030 [Candidatus Wildermuthbacteria bacterium RIFCSPHIGHO2_12_FULL_45_9]|nr:MAG: hypothetical protein A3E07_02030 [Candidatus Wildermuthbacteria bacterium RIFCSPHIGHO2_12_FULL_45_9]
MISSNLFSLSAKKVVLFAIVVCVAAISAILLSYTQIASAASISSVKSGNWSDISTWSTGSVPTTGDSVAISTGHTVVYDAQSDAVLAGVEIMGTLPFSRAVNTRLKTSDNIMVMAGGFLDMGTEASPIPKEVKSEVVFVLPPGYRMQGATPPDNMGFIQGDTGLWAMSGSRWEVSGAPINRTWVKLDADASKGATTITVENDVTDWQVGGSILITQTSNPVQTDSNSFTNENEVRVIASIAKGAGTQTILTLDRPLSFFHKGSDKEKGEVGLLSRNVSFTTDIIGLDETTLESNAQSSLNGREFAHTMLMNGARGDVRYAEFKYMGNFRALSRYPIHFHVMGDTSRGMIVRGNSVWQSGNRAYVMHESNGVLIDDNISYNTVSSPYFIELTIAPDATPSCDSQDMYVQFAPHDNVFSHNLGAVTVAVDTWNSLAGAPSDAGIFWADQKTGQAYIGNVAVGAQARNAAETGRSAGFQFDELCDAPTPSGTSDLILRANEAHSNKENGFLTWCGNCAVKDAVDFHLWRNGYRGFWWASYTNPIKLYNSRFFENGIEAILQWSVHTFHQDNEYIGGSKPSWATKQAGINFNSYVAPSSPDWPGRFIRDTFSNNTYDLMQDHREVTDTCGGPGDPRFSNPINEKGCQMDISEFLGVTFGGSENKIDFGISQNNNPFWRFVDAVGVGSLPSDFYLIRPDHAERKGLIPQQLYVEGKTEYVAGPNALMTKAEDLPSAVTFSGFTNQVPGPAYSFTLSNTKPDYPPVVSLIAAISGNTATLQANATDDKGVTKVEFWHDEKLVSTDTSAPFEATVDLSNTKRKYAYFYAKAYDGYGYTPVVAPGQPYIQASFSNIAQIGPEQMPKSDVARAVASLAITPSLAIVSPGSTAQFSIIAKDQLGDPITVQPNWSVNGGGTINQGGTFQAGSSASANVYTITAQSGSISATAKVIAANNLARGKVSTASSAAQSGSLSLITDGDKDTSKYVEIGRGGVQSAQTDLGDLYDLGLIKLWHYYGGARSYHDVILQLSEDGAVWTTVFNNDTDNSAKQGIGTDAEYTETADGKSVVLPLPIKARYIRAWVNGSTANTGNHFVELEAYGAPVSATPSPTPTPVPTPTPAPTPTAIPTPVPTPTFSPPIAIAPEISKLSIAHIFLDRPSKVVFEGSALELGRDFHLRLKLEGTSTIALDITSQPKTTTELEVDFATQNISLLALGRYEIELERAMDGAKAVSVKKIVITKLGDIWSSGATPATEEKRDGKIDIQDISRLLTFFGNTVGLSTDPQADADVNGPGGLPDSKVDIYDVNKMMANWSR